MTESIPISCSLGADDLERRHAAIAELGAASLSGRETEGSRHLLRFRSDAATRKRLEGIVAAEAKCCPFLDLTLEERDDALVLTIAAPEGAEAVAGELAAAFVGAPG